MNTVTVRLNQEERQAFHEYAKLQGVPLSTLFKKALAEKMEDEFDLKTIMHYEEDLSRNSIELYDHSEVKRLLGL